MRWVVLLVLLAGCKSKQEAQAPKTEAKRAPLQKRATDVVYAASTHLRVVDVEAKRLVKGLDFGRAVSSIAFTEDGSKAFLGTSGGVRVVDAKAGRELPQLSERPVRDLERVGDELFVLEHEVIAKEDGTREVRPFDLVTRDVATGAEKDRKTVGQLVIYASPEGLTIDQSGKIALRGERIDASGGLKAEENALRPRMGTIRRDGKAYVPVEAKPSRVLVVDLGDGSVEAIDLGRYMSMRGLGITPDGNRLLVNAGLLFLTVDLATKKVVSTTELDGGHTGLAVASDGRFAYLAKVIDEKGGAVTMVQLDPPSVVGKMHLDDISPWAIAVRPRP